MASDSELDYIIDHEGEWDRYIERLSQYGYDLTDIDILRRLRERLKAQ